MRKLQDYISVELNKGFENVDANYLAEDDIQW